MISKTLDNTYDLVFYLDVYVIRSQNDYTAYQENINYFQPNMTECTFTASYKTGKMCQLSGVLDCANIRMHHYIPLWTRNIGDKVTFHLAVAVCTLSVTDWITVVSSLCLGHNDWWINSEWSFKQELHNQGYKSSISHREADWDYSPVVQRMLHIFTSTQFVLIFFPK